MAAPRFAARRQPRRAPPPSAVWSEPLRACCPTRRQLTVRQGRRAARSASKTSRRRVRLNTSLRFATSAQYGHNIRVRVTLLGECFWQQSADLAVDRKGARLRAPGRIGDRPLAWRRDQAAKTRIASPENVPQASSVASPPVFPLP